MERGVVFWGRDYLRPGGRARQHRVASTARLWFQFAWQEAPWGRP